MYIYMLVLPIAYCGYCCCLFDQEPIVAIDQEPSVAIAYLIRSRERLLRTARHLAGLRAAPLAGSCFMNSVTGDEDAEARDKSNRRSNSKSYIVG